MVPASIITLGTTVGLWHGMCVKRSILVPESPVGLMEASTITTFAKQMIYSIAIQGFFMLTLIQSAKVRILDYKLLQRKAKND